MTTVCSSCNKAGSGDNALKTCSVCHAAWYCSVECQKEDFASHKPSCTKAGCELLFKAIEDGNEQEIRRLAKTKRVLNVRVDYRPNEKVCLVQWSAMHQCVRLTKPDLMKILIENDAKIEIEDVDQETPLFVASTSRCLECVSTLLAAGANPNAAAEDGWSCVMMAARDGNYDITKALLDYGADLNRGHDMFGRGPLELVNQMRTGQGIRMSEGESFDEARHKYDRIADLLQQHM